MPLALLITIRGIVQGVGFRPFVFRLAVELGIRGWVLNDAGGVRIHAQAPREVLDQFVARLRSEAPAASIIESLDTAAAQTTDASDFRIVESDSHATPTTRISPDLCLCPDCARELTTPTDQRFQYEYINCTNCGPRYSIIESLPYDRAHTTMHEWPMCEACRTQYANPLDRRFHAQPLACPACGPRCRLVQHGREIARAHASITHAAAMLRDGAILAIKGLGGYHLACDARNANAVLELRTRKFRKDKPFALMCASLDSVRSWCTISAAHQALLESMARPIVLMPRRHGAKLPHVAPSLSLSDQPHAVASSSVSAELDELGIMLPYTPLHHLLFAAGAPDPLVLTSANRSSEPIAYRDDDALDRLADLADAFLIGERRIARRVDDSVVAVHRDRPVVVRRARGLAPGVVATLPTDTPILALGTDLKNAIALVVRGQVVLSQHVGDLGDTETDAAFHQTIRDLLDMYAIDRSRLIVAHDLHPEFISTRAAHTLGAARLIGIQHHEAHIAAVLAEHALLDQRVVGVALDGTGFGHDGAIWGGEVFVGSVADGFSRVAHLRTAPLPGGDAAARFPVQAAAGRLSGISHLPDLCAAPFQFPTRYRDATRMIERGIRCHPSSSMGRLFDSVAALLGYVEPVTFEGQAAIWLEQQARTAERSSSAETDLSRSLGAYGKAFAHLDDQPLLQCIVRDRIDGVPVPLIAHRFHAAIADGMAETIVTQARAARTNTVALSGGVMQNALLDTLLTARLEAAALRVLTHAAVPPNDGGIAVGQAAIAARALARG